MSSGEGGKKVREALETSIKNISETLLPLFDESKLRNPFEEGNEKIELKEREEIPISVLDEQKKTLSATSARLEKMSAAFVLAFQGGIEDVEVCIPAVDMYEKALFGLCSAATEAMNLVARPLKMIIAKQITGAINSSLDLMRFMIGSDTDKKNVAVIAGVVWQYCSNINAIKLDDKEIVIKQIQVWIEPIKDAMTELNEIEVADEEDKNDDDDNDDDDEDDDIDDDSMTEKELEVRPPVIDLCKVAILMLKKAYDVLKRLPLSVSPKNVALDDEILYLCNKVSSQIDDTVCSVYRPQVRENIHKNASAVHTSLIRFSQLINTALDIKPDDTNTESDKKTIQLLLTKSETCVSKLNDLAQQH